LSAAALDHLRRIPVVRIASRAEPQMEVPGGEMPARISIRTATHGLQSAGTMYRMDDVPIRTRAVLPSTLPTESDVLAMLEKHLLDAA
jgi:formylmethanofuran dehydrogenase subunit B